MSQPPSVESKQPISNLFEKSRQDLDEEQQRQLMGLLEAFMDVFAARDEDWTHTDLVLHDLTREKSPLSVFALDACPCPFAKWLAA